MKTLQNNESMQDENLAAVKSMQDVNTETGYRMKAL